ncbi:flippase [Howardella ureilytica]
MAKLKVHSVKYNFLMNFILTASGFIFPLITFPYVSVVLGATSNGIVSFVASYSAYFLMVAQLGVPTYGIRACARVRDDKEKLSKTAHEIFIINIIMSVLVLGAYILSIFLIPSLAENRILLLIYSVTIVMNAFGMEWLYKAVEQYDYITVRSLIFKLISIGLMFAFVHQSSDYIIYALTLVLSQVGSYVLNFIRIRKFITLKPFKHYNLRRHIKPLLLLFSQSIAISIYTNLDTIMLGFMSTYEQVGFYNASIRLQSIIASFVASLGTVLLPRMSYYVKNKESDKFLSLMGKALNYATFISMPLAVFVSVMAGDIITFIAGQGYYGAVGSIIFLSLSVVALGLTNIIGLQVLTPLNKDKYVLISVIIGAVVDFVLNFFWIPIYGATGAALSTLICEFAVLAVQIFFARKLLAHVKKTIYLYKYIILGIAAAVPVYFIQYWGIPFSIVRLIIGGVIYAALYLGGLAVIKDPLVNEVFLFVKGKLKKKKADEVGNETDENNISEALPAASSEGSISDEVSVRSDANDKTADDIVLDSFFDSDVDGDDVKSFENARKRTDIFDDDLFGDKNSSHKSSDNNSDNKPGDKSDNNPNGNKKKL